MEVPVVALSGFYRVIYWGYIGIIQGFYRDHTGARQGV